MFKLIVIVCICFDFTQALECRPMFGESNSDIKKTITTCMLPTIPIVIVKVVNNTKSLVTNEDDPEDAKAYGPRRGMGSRNKRQDDDDEPSSTTTSTTTTTTTTTAKPKTTQPPIPEAVNATEEAKKCVCLCLVQSFDMLGPSGLPDHRKVSAALLKSTTQRELRDFLQDSADQCFQEIEQGEKMEACALSAKLITCLAGKGRSNCADWPVGELPFPHKF